MESMRRSLDRSRQPGLKKPRLTDDQPNPSGGGNLFAQRPLAGLPPAAASARYRAAGSDRDSGSNDSVRGGGGAYHPQPLQQNQVQELVNQYKTALAELTFNSKPIITNLTIIAGENVSAAKAIAATVCNHILEVPSEQKLPSLYLLDSIVKNIGRDYAKHFAPRLPEVFCKAYRQVDPPIQSSMRHLFGTWKNVFPIQCLQLIAEELGLSSAVNGSSSGTVTSRSDTQAQRPQHSIHVNPKYLERQQRLQQSGRVATVDSPEDIDRPERTSSIVASRPWADSAVKMHDIQRSQRAALGNPIQEKNIGPLFGDLEYGTDASRNSGLVSGRTVTGASEQGHVKPWFGEAGGVARKLSDPRNGFGMKPGVADHLIPKSTKAAHLQPTESIPRRNSNDISSNWKNSEEEEFMWDMHSRLPDQEVSNLSDNSRKDPWIPSDSKKLGFENHVRRPQIPQAVVSRFDRESSPDSLSTEQRDRLNYGGRLPSPWRPQEASPVDDLMFSGSTTNSGYADANTATNSGFPAMASSLSRITAGPRASSPHAVASGFGGPAGTLIQQRFPSVGAVSPSQQSPLHQPSLPSHYLPRQLPNAADQDYSQVLPQSHQKVRQISRSLLPPNGPSGSKNKFQSEELRSSSSAVASIQEVRQFPLPREQLDYGLSESFGPSQKQNPNLDCNGGAPSTSGSSESDQSIQPTMKASGTSSTSDLLAAVMKSGILSNITTGGLAKQSLQESGQITSKSITKALPSITQAKFAGSKSASTSIRHAKSSTSSASQKDKQQHLPPSPPSLLEQAPIMADKELNPISNLLSSLLVKGLIKSEVSPASSSQVPPEPEIQKISTINPKSAPVSSPPALDEESVAEPGSKSSFDLPKSNQVILKPPTEDLVKLPQSVTAKTEPLIGLKFKPDLVREFHPTVVDSLFDGLPHQCNVCGLRLILKERLDKHLAWHNEMKTNADGRRTTRKWYLQTEDWICPKASIPPVVDSSYTDVCQSVTDLDDEMAPADEDQCVCVLCGELFEDYYSSERDKWMFRGAVPLMPPLGCGKQEKANDCRNGPLVHLLCHSEGSSSQLGLSKGVKMEE